MGDDQHEIPLLWITHRDDEKCAACGVPFDRGNLVHLNRQTGVRCVKCAGFDGLVFLSSGDPALTRRAMAASPRRAIVLKFSQARKRNERQGVMVEQAAVDAAEASCAADKKRREEIGKKRKARAVLEDQEYRKEFEQHILEMYPSCPVEEARAIAEHACRKHSGRVGRSAAAKAFDPKAIRLAVRARIRHMHTDYDEILALEGKEFARGEVSEIVDEIAGRWSLDQTR